MLWELRTDVVVVVVSWCSGLFVGVVGVMVVVVVDVVVGVVVVVVVDVVVEVVVVVVVDVVVERWLL